MRPKPASGRITLKEVAARAGVSASTASLVLTGKAEGRGIPAETNERVRRAALDLNYAPNLLLRSLRRGRTHVVSFYNAFRHRFVRDLYMDRLSAAVEYAGGNYGYDVLVHCNFSRKPQETYQFLNGGLSDGVMIFAPQPEDPLLGYLRRSDLSAVLLNARDPLGQFPSVADDSDEGMRLVADALMERGHRRIAIFVTDGYPDALKRAGLLRQLLAEHGVDIPEHRVIGFVEDRTQTLADLLKEPDPPTAIFCWHDRVAYWALESCEELGISVPDQLSIIGYDGIHWPAVTSHIAASVLVDLEHLADQGMRVLDLYIQGYDGPLIEEDLPVAFSPGTTLGPAPNS